MFINSHRIELTANILIIVVALLFGAVLIKKNFFAPPVPNDPSLNMPSAPAIGSKANVSGVNWEEKSKTVLLVLKKGCQYCTKSAPFYKRLIESTNGKGVRLLAILPDTKEESAAYLNELNLQGLEILQADLADLSVRGTPTLLIVNSKGEITNSWVGQLRAEQEKEVLDKL